MLRQLQTTFHVQLATQSVAMSSDCVAETIQTTSERNLVSGFHTRNTLPHLKREGGAYFVTFRLHGTLPADLIRQLKGEREAIIKQALAAKRPLTWSEQDALFRWY